MKILFLTHRFYPDIGGIEVNSEILATGFYEAGHGVELMTGSSDPGDRKFPFPVRRRPGIYALLLATLRADVVYENNPCLRLSWLAILLGKKRVVALRTWVSRIDGRLAWQDCLKLMALKTASRLIAVSEAVNRRSACHAVVIGNPYRSDLFVLLPTMKLRKGFVFLGRLVSDKGADLAIKALHQLMIDHSDEEMHLSIIGTGPELTRLKILAEDLGITRQVIFTGELRGESLVQKLNEHRFIIVPSVWEEPFGNVVLEGIACGCVPIASDGGGLPDAVGKAGLLFERGSMEALAAVMRYLLRNDPLVQQLQTAGLAHLKNHLPDIVTEKYLTVIKSAIKRR